MKAACDSFVSGMKIGITSEEAIIAQDAGDSVTDIISRCPVRVGEGGGRGM